VRAARALGTRTALMAHKRGKKEMGKAESRGSAVLWGTSPEWAAPPDLSALGVRQNADDLAAARAGGMGVS
jgi:hypothetical protein